MPEVETFTLKVCRSVLGANEAPRWAAYTVPRAPQMMVLDALFRVQSDQDESLSFRCSCRVGMCGSCGVVVNGRPALACQTPVAGLGEVVEVAPMRNMTVIKDLVVDMKPFFTRYEKVMPYLVPADPEAGPAVVPPESNRRGIIDENLECITCGLCFSACSVVASDPAYLGPAALNRAYTLIQDPRDGLHGERLKLIDCQEGVWRCHTQMYCTEHCPRHLSPMATIAQLKEKVVRRRLSRSLPWLSEDE